MNYKFNHDRYEEWVKVSLSWRRDFDGVIFTRMQGLGIIDAELYCININDVHTVLDNGLTVFDHVNIKSYLWILGVYELFRMMDQKIKEDSEIADEDATALINHAKKEFERIRVPLAKFETARRFEGDFSVPN